MSFIDQISPYKGAVPVGLLLPELKIEKRFYAELKIPDHTSNFDFLKTLARRGFERKLQDVPDKTVYEQRLHRELELFYELGFVDYILITWDVMNYCLENSIPCGLGRGSAVSSLVLYLINVTGVDPVRYNLYFERFVSKARAKQFIEDGVKYLDGSLMCDIDNDISYEHRQKVVDYLYSKYPNFVSAISTFATLSGKLCIKECAKILNEVSEDEAKVIADSIPKVFGKVMALEKAASDSEKFSKWVAANNDVFQIARQLEGLIKNTSVHPSGIAIGRQEIEKLSPIVFDSENRPVSVFEMDTVSNLMVKIDILGLRTLSVVDDACKRIGIDWKAIDPSHPSIYAAMQDLQCPKGIFQIEADATCEVLRKVKPQNLAELSDVVALSRPGALAYVGDYVDVKNGNSILPQRQEKLDAILNETKGIFIYQESLMRVAHEVFGLSLEDAEQIRRATGKKKPEEMRKWESKIRSQGKKLHIDQSVIDFYWEALIASADYSFNKCLSPESVVETPNGQKLLHEVNTGDEVLSFDFDSGQTLFTEVTDKSSTQVELFEVELEDGNVITCSMDHKMMCEDGKMRPLKEILSQKRSIVCID